MQSELLTPLELGDTARQKLMNFGGNLKFPDLLEPFYKILQNKTVPNQFLMSKKTVLELSHTSNSRNHSIIHIGNVYIKPYARKLSDLKNIGVFMVYDGY